MKNVSKHHQFQIECAYLVELRVFASDLDFKMVTIIDTLHSDMIHDAQFDFPGRRVATCSSDTTVRIYQVESSGVSSQPGIESSKQKHRLIAILDGLDTFRVFLPKFFIQTPSSPIFILYLVFPLLHMIFPDHCQNTSAFQTSLDLNILCVSAMMGLSGKFVGRIQNLVVFWLLVLTTKRSFYGKKLTNLQP